MSTNAVVLPVLAVRGIVLFPGTTINFDIGREISVKALQASSENETEVFIVAQADAENEEVNADNLCKVGTVAKIKQVMNKPGNLIRVAVKGVRRAKLGEIVSKKPYIEAQVLEFDEFFDGDRYMQSAYVRRLKSTYEQYFSENMQGTVERYANIMTKSSLPDITNLISTEIDADFKIKQQLLEEADLAIRAELLIIALEDLIKVNNCEREIDTKVKKSIDKNQREYYLREQLKVIHEELGDKENIDDDAEEFKNKIEELIDSKTSKEKLLKDVARYSRMAPSSPESSVLRNYLETVLSLPWKKMSDEITDIAHAREILDNDHYGLEKVKERVLEYLCIRQLTKGKNSSIICLCGPPGVAKTSVAKSVARALNRNFVRISLGGIHDESDIRGHRKTYIGAMEGRIMSAISEAKTKNPLILLDEIDKMGADYKGDPSAALLEVLDYEQNNVFRDHYIEIPFDLSQVLFITTANSLEGISGPLRDRMEIIELDGYTATEKFHIAKNYLIDKTLLKNGLTKKQFNVNDKAINDIISYYTREAGVRKLEQQLDALARKAAISVLEDNKPLKISSKNLEQHLGKRRFHFDMMNKKPDIGVVRGLAWTAVGGDTLSIEVNIMAGSGKIELTGKLGDVMQESAKAAISYIRANCKKLGIEDKFYKTKDIHIHVPEGAVPKDGPSAGITMATALVSALSKKAVRNDVAMTGEITLRGRVLPIGGLKEKSMAAYRAGIKTVIIPYDNSADIDDVPEEIRQKINFIPVTDMCEVIKNALIK